MSVTGDADGPATKAGVAVVDVLCGLHATVGILAALQARAPQRDAAQPRRGQPDAVGAVRADKIRRRGYLAAGVVPSRLGNAHPSVAPYEVFPVQGPARIVIAVGTDRQFTSLCEALGLPAIAADAPVSRPIPLGLPIEASWREGGRDGLADTQEDRCAAAASRFGSPPQDQ